ncbi:hypothetical protein ACFYV5_32075 [Streptomyces sp. NPDC003035]|uniref:hypothetical protein n=1 Tax=Streptomyces sp. NPDC003035 TaxID=3364676 RepID=UPI003691FAA5
MKSLTQSAGAVTAAGAPVPAVAVVAAECFMDGAAAPAAAGWAVKAAVATRAAERTPTA